MDVVLTWSDDYDPQEHYGFRAGTACTCTKCVCADPAEVDLGDGPVCGCCAADCPDKHEDSSAPELPT